MSRAERGLAERARVVLQANGGRASEAELLGALFGAAADPWRWGGLVDVVLSSLPEARRVDDGCWELAAVTPLLTDRPTELDFVAVTTVATSADPWRARLAMVAAVRVQGGRIAASFEASFNPRSRLPRYLVAATGLTQAEVEESPPFAERADELLDFFGRAVLVGVDIRAQVEAIGHELSRLDRPGVRNPLIDLGQLAARVGLPAARRNLPALAEASGLSHPRPYHPATDARVAARVAGRLLTRAATHDLTVAALLEGDEPEPPGALSGPVPPTAADGPGVYLLKDAEERVLYVGKARNLRRRLGAYHRRPLGLLRRLEGLAAAVHSIETIATSGELEALVVEARLLRRHEPRFNTQRRRRPAALFLRADLTEARAGLTACREVAADGASYLGPFRTASAATAALRLTRELFPDLKGRGRAGAAARRPAVHDALRFLSGRKREVLARLRREQRALAAAGDRIALERSLGLLRRAIAFDFDAAALGTQPLAERLLVLSPTSDSGLLAHVVQGGRLLACFEPDDLDEARSHAAALPPPEASDNRNELDDERSIVLRWLCGLGPEHRIERVQSKE